MADGTVYLTYRELAERLGISPDGARMKARRAVKAGRWRIVPGNHPSDQVRVELPAAEAERSSGDKITRSRGERTGRTNGRTDQETLAATLQTAQARIAELTDQLTAEKDQHRQTAIDLATATARLESLEADLARLEATADDLRFELQAARRTWWQRLTGR